jgi:two-component system NtrC family sensor kinase
MSSPAAELHQMAAVGRLLAGVVHEINSPLASIFSNTEVLEATLARIAALLAEGNPESTAKAAALATSGRGLVAVDRIACERIRAVIRGLKTLSRTDAPEPRRVNLNQQLLDTLKLTEAEFRRRIDVRTDLGELPEVDCYPQMLNQVFLNLLVNAGQAIEGEGTITVSTRVEGELVHIAIADTGRGMTRETLARVFDEGFTTKPVGVGTGLGLSIARDIIERKHGGAISMQSEPAKGTTVDIRIPLRRTRSVDA